MYLFSVFLPKPPPLQWRPQRHFCLYGIESGETYFGLLTPTLVVFGPLFFFFISVPNFTIRKFPPDAVIHSLQVAALGTRHYYPFSPYITPPSLIWFFEYRWQPPPLPLFLAKHVCSPPSWIPLSFSSHCSPKECRSFVFLQQSLSCLIPTPDFRYLVRPLMSQPIPLFGTLPSSPLVAWSLCSWESSPTFPTSLLLATVY